MSSVTFSINAASSSSGPFHRPPNPINSYDKGYGVSGATPTGNSAGNSPDEPVNANGAQVIVFGILNVVGVGDMVTLCLEGDLAQDHFTNLTFSDGSGNDYNLTSASADFNTSIVEPGFSVWMWPAVTAFPPLDQPITITWSSSGGGGGGSVTLTWTEAVSGISQVDTYLIYRSVDGAAYERLATFLVERDFMGARTNELTYLDDGLSVGHTYSYYVIGRPVQGPDSAPSNIKTFTIASAVATSPVLSTSLVGLTGAQLDWTESTVAGSTIDTYQIYRDKDGNGFHYLGAVAAPTLTYSDLGLTPGSTYTYYVVAVPVEGIASDPSNQSSETMPPPSGSYIALEAGGHITLEDGSGAILLENPA